MKLRPVWTRLCSEIVSLPHFKITGLKFPLSGRVDLRENLGKMLKKNQRDESTA